MAGAESTGAPVVLQVSENAVKFRYGRLLPLARAAVAAAERADVPVALHLDHVQSDDLLRQAHGAGFSSVMYDAARLPYAQNLAATRPPPTGRTPKGCGSRRSWGRSAARTAGPRWTPTHPVRAPIPTRRATVARAEVDALAVAIGSVHAMTTRSAALDHGLLKRLSAALTVPLVLHGSSGVPDDGLVAAVAGGIAKVNVGTALNAAMTSAIRDFLAAHPEAVDSRKYLSVGREAMAREVARIIGVLGREPGASPA
ncbi:class II fructose-bisphosphate aldolase [Streptomyces diastatochromogenes]|nr:class II fructose-bisphosphate aldolase [Streptomyces diastatochromogenes]